jgi:hypothetical protein
MFVCTNSTKLQEEKKIDMSYNKAMVKNLAFWAMGNQAIERKKNEKGVLPSTLEPQKHVPIALRACLATA